MQHNQVCGVYIVASPDHYSLYVGMSTVLPHRIQSHKDGLVSGWAKDYNCTKLVYYQLTDNEEQALYREKQIKGWTRLKKTVLIEQRNPAWVDLFQELIDGAVGY